MVCKDFHLMYNISMIESNIKIEFEKSNFENSLFFIRDLIRFSEYFFVSCFCARYLTKIGEILGNNELIFEGIELFEKSLNNSNAEKIHFPSIYNELADSYYIIYQQNIHENRLYYLFDESELDLSMKYYKKVINSLIHTPEIYVNLANTYDCSGRTIESLEFYQKALKLNPNHSMALGNKGIALFTYARLSGVNIGKFLKDAYLLLNKALGIGIHPSDAKYFSYYIDNIKKIIPDEKFLEKELISEKIRINSNNRDEEELIKFCLENKLYLNFCTFCQDCDSAIGDNIVIKSILADINEVDMFNTLSGGSYYQFAYYINQIKQDYVTARFLLFSSQNKNINMDFVDNNVKLINTLSYNEYDIYSQFLMFSFKNMYDILDKIAFFINDYLSLGLKENKIDFSRIWYTKTKKNIKDKIRKTNNLSLHALFKISQDLNGLPKNFDSSYSRPKGDHEVLRFVRNGITHRFIQIRLFNAEKEDYNIMSREELLNYTFQISKIVRNAIIYLIQFVNIEEEKKQKKLENEEIGTLFL